MWKLNICNDFSKKSILYPFNENIKINIYKNVIDKNLILNDNNICTINFIQLILLCFICVLLILIGIYIIIKYNYKNLFSIKWKKCRRYNVAQNTEQNTKDNDNNINKNLNKINSLFILHNLRSSIELILLIINSLELCRTLLPITINLKLFKLNKNIKYNYINNIIILSPPFLLSNSILTILTTFILICYHRILEFKNLPGLLYISIPLEVLLSLLRIYQNNFADISFIELESVLNICNSACLLSLALISSCIIYKERYKSNDKKTNDLKIGYKHSIATFYSKVIFWWLTPLLWHGYTEPLEQDDLGYLREEDSARAYYDHFLLIYIKECAEKTKPSLWYCYLKSSWKWFTLGGFLKLLGDLSALIGPLSIHQIVDYIQNQYDLKSIKIMNSYQNNFNLHSIINNKTIFTNNYNNLEEKFGFLNKEFNVNLLYSIENLQLLQNFSKIINKNNLNKFYYYYPSWYELLSNGWIIAWIILVSSIGQGGLSQASTHLLNITGIHIKTSLQGLIYRKTLLLNSSCLDTNNKNKISDDKDLINNNLKNKNNKNKYEIDNNNGKRDIGSITNLMSEDALNIMSFFWIAHYVWAIPLKIGLVMYLLYLKLGISAIIGSFVCIFTMTPLQFLIGKAMSKNSEISAQCTDERLKRINDIFMGIKLIKLNVWENVFCDKIRTARNKELKYLNKDSFYWTLMTFLTHISSALITFVTLAVYVKLEGDAISQPSTNDSKFYDKSKSTEHIEFTASRLFSALALFNQLTVPLLIFPITIPIIISAIVSTKRLENFLQENEIEKDENEGVRHMARILCKSNADIYESIDKKSPILKSVLTSSTKTMNPLNVALNLNKDKNNFALELDQKKNIDSIEEKLHEISPLTVTNDFNDENIRKTKLQRDIYCHTFPKKPYCGKSLKENSNKADAKEKLNYRKLSEVLIGGLNKIRQKSDQINLEPKVKPELKINLKNIGKSNSVDLIESIESNTVELNCKNDMNKIQNKNIELLKDKNASYVFGRGSDGSIDISSVKMRNKGKKPMARRESINFETSDAIAVTILNAKFSWNSNCESLLKVDELHIPKGKLTVVVGKNGSGKSSLLAALLKEIHKISGEVKWNKYSTIAYVPQTPWLLNASIRDNILFGESYRPKRYEKVLEACALKPDIELMPEGDMTVISERGINLSGGQQQRIVIARSLYSSANVVIMDDPFSSLDNEVAKHVFDNSIKKMLLKTNRTIILVTQRIQLVYSADYIIVMNDGYVQSAGSYNDIEKNHPSVITEWNSIIAKGNDRDQISPGKTTRERWKLYKNISRICMQRPQDIEQDQMMSTQSLLMQSKRRSSVFGSRHLIYDIPIPIDECQNDDIIIKRRSFHGSKRSLILMGLSNFMGGSSNELKSTEHKNCLVRVKSLQPNELRSSELRTPVVRNISSPGRFYDSKPSKSGENDLKSKTSFRQFLNRMSSRRSNVGTKLHRSISPSNSIQSITEESHPTLNRNESTSTDLWDNESEQDPNEPNSNESSAVVNDEERKYGEIPLQIYMLYLRSSGLRIVLLFFITALIWQCLRIYTDVWLQNWTDFYSKKNSIEMNNINNVFDNNKKNYIKYYFNVYTIISGICILMTLISTPAGQIAGCNARKKLHDQLLLSILSKPLYFFQITPMGRIINRFSNDMAIIDKKIAPTSQRLLQFTFLCLFAVLINLAITPWFIIITIPICIAYYIIQKFYRCSSRELQRLENITNSPVISHFNETIQGVTTIRAFSQESRFTETLFKRLEANTIAFVLLNTSNRWLGIALDYLGGIIVFLSIITALIASSISLTKNDSKNINMDSVQDDIHIEQEQFLSPSLVGLAINYTLLIPIYLNWVVKLIADMEMYIGSVERVAYYKNIKLSNNISCNNEYNNNADDVNNIDILNKNNDDGNNDNNLNKKKFCCISKKIKGVSSALNHSPYKSVPISWPQKGDIFFDNISLRYEGQNENVITDLTLKIPVGQKIGICGRTGSGKSSLALSLFNVLNVVNGKIYLDDIDITKIHSDEIRSRLSIIPQDVHLFQTTIRENLDPNGHYSDLELWNCLELSQLKDIIQKMPMGLDTEIIDDGSNLSAGQRQLFCLARAILRGSVCLVLDEATSSLDSATERALMNAAHSAFSGRTIITIAHRLSTLLTYDRIIVLENGKIIEDDTPNELKNASNSKFFSMLNSGNS